MKWAHSRLSYFKDLEAENLRLKLELSSLENTKQLAVRTQSENMELKKREGIMGFVKSINFAPIYMSSR